MRQREHQDSVLEVRVCRRGIRPLRKDQQPIVVRRLDVLLDAASGGTAVVRLGSVEEAILEAVEHVTLHEADEALLALTHQRVRVLLHQYDYIDQRRMVGHVHLVGPVLCDSAVVADDARPRQHERLAEEADVPALPLSSSALWYDRLDESEVEQPHKRAGEQAEAADREQEEVACDDTHRP